jgi:phage baseplate assembly protein W
MLEHYLKIPVDFSKVLKGEGIKNCSIEESIAQFIMTLITCRYGEVSGMNDFGSEIWELEFSQLIKIHDWEEKVRNSIILGVKKYETRLKDVEVNVKLSEIEDDKHSKKYAEVRRQALIYVSGIIRDTDQQFNFNTKIYVSPLSQ